MATIHEWASEVWGNATINYRVRQTSDYPSIITIVDMYAPNGDDNNTSWGFWRRTDSSDSTGTYQRVYRSTTAFGATTVSTAKHGTWTASLTSNSQHLAVKVARRAYNESSTLGHSSWLNCSVWRMAYHKNNGSNTVYTVKHRGVDRNIASAPSHSADTYTIAFNSHGGTTASNTSSQKTYTFSKWWTSSDFTGTSYAAGATYTANAAVSLYAKYTTSGPSAIKLATVTRDKSSSKTTATVSRIVYFNANGGTSGASSLTSTATKTTTTTSTYSFNGWYTAASGGTKMGNAGASYTPTTVGTVTAHAQWNTTNSTTYATGTFSTITLPTLSRSKSSSVSTATVSKTITFNANGGTTTKANQVSTATKTTTQTTTYTSSGWFTATSGGTLIGLSGATYRPTGTMTAYAQWGSTNSTTYATGTFSNITFPTTTQCTRTNYTLLGFHTSSTATSQSYNPGASTSGGSLSTVYAVWKANRVVWIWNGSTWKAATPWVWNGSAWKQAQAYVWNGSAWK